jgi:galactokinase
LQGSGLSSSAAIEVLFAKIFDTLYGAGECTALELAQIGQKAENDYFGKPCGLEDQAASAFGGAIKIDFARKDAPLVTPVSFDPARAGYALCVVNTGGNHADLTPDYAAIPGEMRAVARELGKSVLGETDRESLMQHTVEIRKTCGDRALLRALHFFDENERVEAMAAAVQRGDPQFMDTFLALVEASGDSSDRQLQNIHSPRYPEEQGVALALALSRAFFKRAAVRGVCRVHGGGFAGTIQAYVPLDAFDAYRQHMEATFGPGAVTLLCIRALGAVEVRI